MLEWMFHGNLCRTIGPLLSQRFLLASAKAQPRGGFLTSQVFLASASRSRYLRFSSYYILFVEFDFLSIKISSPMGEHNAFQYQSPYFLRCLLGIDKEDIEIGTPRQYVGPLLRQKLIIVTC